ncbi:MULTISPECIES: hypothetical protein [Micromonospora]|uniref:hypothetical protein n=1 Tax=Micromonospora TaxID=1873 RepID=UPI000EF60502|nr:hypothetical protein [Micromonospora sp. BL1]RLQ04345.1 hypothetical protein EAD96_15060 [Micromonospora sp. BL1]
MTGPDDYPRKDLTVTYLPDAANQRHQHGHRDWDYSHYVGTAGGDIHCVTNVQRDLGGTTPWWRPAR